MRKKTWTIAEAKARLSEILRLATREGPQHIGTRAGYVIVPLELWEQQTQREPLGRWLVENLPRGAELPEPDRREVERPGPFDLP